VKGVVPPLPMALVLLLITLLLARVDVVALEVVETTCTLIINTQLGNQYKCHF
jgi:hypothetical protein